MKGDYKSLQDADRDKIDKLKRQYLEHKKLWETEKLILLNTKDMEFSWDQVKRKKLSFKKLAYIAHNNIYTITNHNIL